MSPRAPDTGTDPAHAAAVASWAGHLREGGTTTWAAWRERSGAAPRAGLVSGPLPDATHLELLRRLNLHPGARSSRALADVVLATPAPGRGQVDVPLVWPGHEHRFGTPPVEPEALPSEELVRLAVGVLVQLVAGLPPLHAPPPEPRPWPLPWRRRLQVHGSPRTTREAGAMLHRQGWVESSWRSRQVVVALPLETMMAEQWAAATTAGNILKWSTWWRAAIARGRLPAAVDLAAQVERLAAEGRSPEVVVARDPQHALAAVAGLLGARESAWAPVPDLAHTDLLRRTNRLLGLRVGPGRAGEVRRRLLADVVPPASAAAEGTPSPPSVPVPAREWAGEVAAEQAQRLRRGGYPVHGDLADLAARQGDRLDGTVDRDRTLTLALTACRRAAQLTDQPLQEGS